MERAFARVALAALFAGAALAQDAPKNPVFEAADVRLRPVDPFMSARAESFMSGGLIPNGKYELHRANMTDLIRVAYGIQDYEVYGGPAWLETDHYEVVAKAPPGSKPDDLKLMLQALLADRFKLVVHKAEEPIDANAITVVKSGLFKQSESAGQPGCKPEGANAPSDFVIVNCQHMTMAVFAQSFRNLFGPLPTVDLTGLKGAYDFTLKLPRGGPPRAGGQFDAGPPVSIPEAIEKQLGLKVVTGKHSVPVLVVDSVNRTPTPNAPGVEKILGEATEFEAASIKPTKPGDPNSKFQLTRGRLEVENIPLRTLIGISRNLFPPAGVRQGFVGSDSERNFERDIIVGGPKWLDSDCFDIVAKTDDATLYSPEQIPDHMATMLRALLAERFKLVTHTEQRPVPVWALVVGKGGPKLTPADPKSRSGCKWTASEIRTGSAAIPLVGYVCKNVTMAQLADSLHGMGRDYVDRAAVDMTGLKGGYDFTIHWARTFVIDALRAKNPAAGAGSIPEASEAGAPTMFDALEKIGLKLESGRKAPQPVIVIDHVEPLTPDN
jgi:uncharacterized protein (TIGR03435 family)